MKSNSDFDGSGNKSRSFRCFIPEKDKNFLKNEAENDELRSKNSTDSTANEVQKDKSFLPFFLPFFFNGGKIVFHNISILSRDRSVCNPT